MTTKDFNDAAYNKQSDKTERALSDVSIYKKDGVTTAYVTDWTLFDQRPALETWAKDSYPTINNVVFGVNPDNFLNKLAAVFGRTVTPPEARGEKLYQGPLHLALDSKPVSLTPEYISANAHRPF